MVFVYIIIGSLIAVYGLIILINLSSSEQSKSLLTQVLFP